MLYLAKIHQPDAVGLVVGRDYAAVLRQVGSASSELGAWGADLRVERIHAAAVPIAPATHPMRVRFEVRPSGGAPVRGVAIVLPEDGGGDLFSADFSAWINFIRGWSPDGDFELIELEVAQTAATE